MKHKPVLCWTDRYYWYCNNDDCYEPDDEDVEIRAVFDAREIPDGECCEACGLDLSSLKGGE